MNRRTFLPGLIFALIITNLHGGATGPAAMEPACDRRLYGPVERVGTITDPDISEASGMAASLRDDNLFWVINDSGNPSTLFAIGADGNTRATFTIADTPNCDWEDLAAFSLEQTPYLLIADIGDNLAGRSRCSLYIVREPEVSDTRPEQEQLLPVEWQIRFSYPDGPRDCEAVAVDARQKQVLLLSKRDRPPVLYELPLMPSSEVVVATVIGPMTTIPPPTPEDIKQPYGFVWSRPTAMDLSTDGNRLVVLTYKQAYAFDRAPGQSWQSVITAPAVCIPLPHPTTGILPIREALCVQPGTGDLFITGEVPPAPVFRLIPVSNQSRLFFDRSFQLSDIVFISLSLNNT